MLLTDHQHGLPVEGPRRWSVWVCTRVAGASKGREQRSSVMWGKQEKSRRNRRISLGQGHFLSDSCDKRRDGGKDENTELKWEGSLSETLQLGHVGRWAHCLSKCRSRKNKSTGINKEQWVTLMSDSGGQSKTDHVSRARSRPSAPQHRHLRCHDREDTAGRHA